MSYIVCEGEMTKDASITVRVSADLKAHLDEAARSAHRSTSSLVTSILYAWSGENGGVEAPKQSRPVGRPRSDATRAQALKGVKGLLPWLMPLIGDAERITVDEIIEKGRRPGAPPAAAGIEMAIANALHGLGWTECDEVSGDGTTHRVWTR